MMQGLAGVLPRVAFDTFRFGEPVYLWLLAVPAALVVVWGWHVFRRRRSLQRFSATRRLPVKERLGAVGDLAFWAAVLVAACLVIAALARPRARVAAVRRASADVVILQDASASMYVTDVRPDRWRRSVQFLRTFAETLSWQGDRVALALFAQLAAPQVRLTKDPNALFFFIDHLGDRSPFPLENLTTWDTNIEEGIRWGLRLIEKDEEMFGNSGNPKAFLVVSDGQAWSGQVSNAIQQARARQIPLHVIGVGTTVGGMIPEPMGPDGRRPPPVIRSSLDRNSLVQLAVAGGGEYFEIGSDPDRVVAFRIVDRLRQRADVVQEVESVDELYPRFLTAAGIVLLVGTALMRRRTELVWQAAGAGAVAAFLASLIA
jgi:Ca-activated chloride channel family protein